MRFEDKAAQCSATVTVLADGHECQEYNASGDEHANLKCYIPLLPGQTISVRVALDMTSEHFEVDLFTDGVIRNFWQSSRNTVNKHRSPSVEFTQGIYRIGRSLYRSPLSTVAIPEGTYFIKTTLGSATNNSPELNSGGLHRANVGSISIAISKQDVYRNAHYHGCMEPGQVQKDWYEQALVPIAEALQPSLQIMLRDGTRMVESDRTGTRKRLSRPRQGQAPWSTFSVLYREPEQLRAAGFLDPAPNGLDNVFACDCTLVSTRKRAAPSHVDLSPAPKALCVDSVKAPGPSVSSFMTRAAPFDPPTGPQPRMEYRPKDLDTLSTEVLELQKQADRAKRICLQKAKETDALICQARLEYAKADLECQIADEKAKIAAQEVRLPISL
ncbi:MAG: hypothetical protein Q9181_003298 [Wetmoreana brouardii]